MRKLLLHIFSLKALVVLYIPIYAMFHYQFSLFDIGLNTALLFALFWELKDIVGIRAIDEFDRSGFEIITTDDIDKEKK